jgi:asparagine synthase (glutamine-hydrolysing)
MQPHLCYQKTSVACSKCKITLEWDEAFKNMNDPSGRAVANVHDDTYLKCKESFFRVKIVR